MSGFREVRQDLGMIPRVEDGWTFLYVEHRQVHQDAFGIRLVSEMGVIQVPISQIKVLMIGPGVSVTSAAMLAMSDHGCSVVWVGENGVRFYGSAQPATNKSDNLARQARMWVDPKENSRVVRRMYVQRYGESFPESDNLAVLRGHEGVRVKHVYMTEATRLGLTWKGRNWVLGGWDVTDKMNRCLSVASSCLYGLCHAVIVAIGFSPGLGFIHTGDLRSFVLDVADMYREKFTIPVAFAIAATCGSDKADGATRKACRDAFNSLNLVGQIVPDIYEVLGLARVGASFIDIAAWEALRPKA